MKKCAMVINAFLLFSVFIMPVGKIIFACFGYNFEFANNILYSALVAALSVAAVIVNLIAGTESVGKFMGVLFAICIAFFLLGCCCFLFEIRTTLFVGLLLTAAGCCFYLTHKFGKPLALKVISFTLSALMIVGLVYIGFLGFIFADFGVDTIVKSADSPSGKYRAEVISSDQGALGGDTIVRVSSNKDLINLLVFRVYKKPQIVYFGDWLEYEGMSICWENDERLIINSKAYHIE